jgi:hypothetical protein
MKQLIGKSCKITIKDPVNGRILYYTVRRIIDISDTHINFIDKFGFEFCYRTFDCIQIQDINDGDGG